MFQISEGDYHKRRDRTRSWAAETKGKDRKEKKSPSCPPKTHQRAEIGLLYGTRVFPKPNVWKNAKKRAG